MGQTVESRKWTPLKGKGVTPGRPFAMHAHPPTDELEALLVRAFNSGLRPPRDLAILRNDDSEEFVAAIKGREWRNISFEETDYFRDAFHYMTPEAKRYYLPAYLAAGLNGHDESCFAAVNAAIGTGNYFTWENQVSGLTNDQVDAVLQIIKHFALKWPGCVPIWFEDKLALVRASLMG